MNKIWAFINWERKRRIRKSHGQWTCFEVVHRAKLKWNGQFEEHAFTWNRKHPHPKRQFHFQWNDMTIRCKYQAIKAVCSLELIGIQGLGESHPIETDVARVWFVCSLIFIGTSQSNYEFATGMDFVSHSGRIFIFSFSLRCLPFSLDLGGWLWYQHNPCIMHKPMILGTLCAMNWNKLWRFSA